MIVYVIICEEQECVYGGIYSSIYEIHTDLEKANTRCYDLNKNAHYLTEYEVEEHEIIK